MDREFMKLRPRSGKSMPRVRQRLGKYRIEKIVGEGGFATVYGARDTIEGLAVALKIFRDHKADRDTLELFRQEARLHAKLDHPHILPIKDANVIDGHFVIVTRLGEGTLADRMAKRMSVRSAVHFAEQMLSALAHAHDHRVIHLDVKPENFILFPEDTLKLTDFGIARFALRTIQGSGSGTVGYSAPEQAMGRPSYRSDVFSVGLLLWRMFGGHLPEWPFPWPPKGYDRIRKNLHPDLIAFLRRAIEVVPASRFADCSAMYDAFCAISATALRSDAARRGRRSASSRVASAPTSDWRQVRWKQFRREYGKALECRHECPGCTGPVSESMLHCPWCRKDLAVFRGEARGSRRCKRCKRGMKADWRFCAWCYGAKFEPKTTREYSDQRYEARCTNPSCTRKELMPFMRYCPWCRTKVKKKWKIQPSGSGQGSCRSCGWGVLRDYWNHCPWCAKKIGS